MLERIKKTIRNILLKMFHPSIGINGPNNIRLGTEIKILNGCHVSFMTIHGSAGVDISEENINNMTPEEIKSELFYLKYRLYYCQDTREAMSIECNMVYYDSLLKDKDI